MKISIFALVADQCETHARRMQWATHAIGKAFPLTAAGLREIRNAFAHDYPDDSEMKTAILNRAFVAARRLLEILHHVKKFSARYERG